MLQHCEKCHHDATLIQSVRGSVSIGYVDYYRCPVCGEVWTVAERPEVQHVRAPRSLQQAKSK
jgi:hypothetical protein